jgi:chorismate synthase
MKNTFGNSVTVTLAGESHGEAIVVTLDGLKPGIAVSEDAIAAKLALRRPSGTISTTRREADEFRIVSGVFEGRTTGTPLCILIPNTAKRSTDYEATRYLPRPGHADLTASMKYGGFQDYRGGGHFSGRVTVGLVTAGAIAEAALAEYGVKIGTHIAAIGAVNDRKFADLGSDLAYLSDKNFPVLDEAKAEAMKQVIEEARLDRDSVGGVLETAVIGLGGGYGEPWFDTVESMLSHILFAIPAVKGVEFGDGFALAKMRGSQANDAMENADGSVTLQTAHAGGIFGGISVGAPIVVRTAVKPTPTIFKPQNTVDFGTMTDTVLDPKGRHDPAIVHRARIVQDAATAIVLCDCLALRFGTDWLR